MDWIYQTNPFLVAAIMGAVLIPIVAAIYGGLVFIFWRDIRRAKKKSKTITGQETYWKQSIG